MRNKVRKSLAFLLALALVVSVMSGLGLSVSAEQESNTPGTEEVQQQDKTEAGAAPSEVKAEEEAAKPEEKPVQEEKKDEQKTEAKENADKPAEKQEKATPKAGENVQTATIGTGDKTVTVKTTAAAGVLPEGAKLVVKKLANQDQAYQDAESTLKDSQVTYDDFLALDVGFEVNGKEVEPEAGSVQVQFELGAGLLPETADTSTLAVQHLTDGKAETVADAGAVTAGDVTVKNQVVKADFEVQSFSTFTITWSGNRSTYFQVTVHYVDESGKEISRPTSNSKISNGDTVTFADKAATISGYTYQGAHYDTYSGDVVTKMTATEESWGLGTTRYLTFYNGDSQVEQLEHESWQWTTQTADVWLVYKADETGGGGSSGGAITEEQSLTREKYVTPNEGGSYDLSLTVSGAKGTQANPAKLDIVLVLDKSGSMTEQLSDRTTRLKAIKDAAGTFIDAVGNNQSIDAKYKVITFSGPNSIPREQPSLGASANCITSGWVAGSNAKNEISKITASGGTNYEAGIEVAKTEMKNTRDGAQTAVIFFSDGVPTFRQTYKSGGASAGYSYPDNGWGNGQTDPSGYNLDAAKAAAANLTCNYFYCIGTGGAVPESLNELASSANSVTHGSHTTNSAADLAKIFEDIAADITTFLCSNVTVTDVLSDNVQMVMGSDNKPKKLVVTVKDKNGNTVATPDGITASYDADQKKIVMDFPDDYKLNPEYTYIVTATIEATEKAYENYRANGNAYPDTGETGTGATSADQKGVFSNKDGEAKVTYTYNQKEGSAEYPMPVIQLHPGTLIVKKNIQGDLTAEEKTALVNKMTVDVTINNEEVKVPLSKFTPGNDGTYTLTREGLSPGTTYSVTESDANVEGYELTTTPSTLPVSGSAAGDATETVHITNSYTPSNRTITLKKIVDGNMGDKDQSFTFSATNATLGENSLKDGKTTTITAKVGETVTITEDDYTSDGYTTTATATEGVNGEYKNHSYTFTVTKDMNESTVITFTNTKTINPPSGIITTIAPYAIMVVLAAGAGVYFVYSRRRRNR